jgi:hypothetical protein
MKKEIKDKIKNTLPAFVLDNLYSDYSADAIGKIIDDYIRDEETMDNLKDIIGLIVLKEIKIEEVFDFIKKLGLDDRKAKDVTSIVLCEILFPMKDFFPGIEDVIVKLGGEIPKTMPVTIDQQMLKREKEMEEMEEAEEREQEEAEKDMMVSLPITELTKAYPQVESQRIGSQESIIVQGSDVPMKPEIKYWMKDYMEKAGYRTHSNLDRVSYVYHDKNTKNMNEEERRQLGLILKSFDEEIPLPYSTKHGKIDFSKIAEE